METMPDFRFLRPTSLAQALDAFRSHPRARYVAGGTDLLPNLRRGLGAPGALIALAQVAELKGIEFAADGGMRIGAGVSLAEVAREPRIRKEFTAIAEAAEAVAGPTHRAAATLGGNLCVDTRCIFFNESDWWRKSNEFCMKYEGADCHVAKKSVRCFAAYQGDVAPALLAFGAEIELAGPDGTRRIPLDEFYEDEGMRHLKFGPGEIIVAVYVPEAPGVKSGYHKIRVRGSIDFPLAGIAVALRQKDGMIESLKIGLTGTDSRPVLAQSADAYRGKRLDEAALAQLETEIRRQIQPMKSTFTAPKYRRRVASAAARRLAARLAA